MFADLQQEIKIYGSYDYLYICVYEIIELKRSILLWTQHKTLIHTLMVGVCVRFIVQLALCINMRTHIWFCDMCVCVCLCFCILSLLVLKYAYDDMHHPYYFYKHFACQMMYIQIHVLVFMRVSLFLSLSLSAVWTKSNASIIVFTINFFPLWNVFEGAKKTIFSMLIDE